MADKSNLVITMTDYESGKEQQKTITDINPTASSSKLATWGQMTAALSKDGYVKTTRIDRTECDNDTRTPFPKAITVAIWNDAQNKNVWTDISNVSEPINMDLKTFGEASTMSINLVIAGTSTADSVAQHSQGYITNIQSSINFAFTKAEHSPTNNNGAWVLVLSAPNKTTGSVTFDIRFDETYTHTAYSKTFTINITGGE